MIKRLGIFSGAVIALVMISATALAGCGVNIGGVTLERPSASTILATAEKQTWKDATFKFTVAVTSTSATGTSTGTGTVTTHPQRSDIHATTSSSLGNQTDEVITDGSTAYVKTPGQSKWLKITGNPSSLSGAGGISPTSPVNFGSLQNVTFVGAETVEGYKTWHVKGTTAQTVSGKTVTSNIDVWVRQDNSYIVQVKSHSVESGATGAVDTTITFTKWNTGVTITPPPASDVTTQAS
ncbi:MAG TPA: LppX_LprAFG lipoprotein [Ktedonobacterales bacterium]|nr:LppX_LprAFG lipoprotein [Ktedonobacterales bacterium]